MVSSKQARGPSGRVERLSRRNHDAVSLRPRAAWQAPVEEGRRQRLDRLGARVLRLLHLRHGGVADLPADLLSFGQSHGRDRRLAGDLRRRLRRAADRRLRPRALGRYARPQDRADPVHVPDGLLDDGRRPPADLSAGRHARADAPRHPPPDPGLRRRRRDLRCELDDPRARAVRPARLLRELHPAGRAGRADPGRGGVPAACRLYARGGVQFLGLADPVPPQRLRHHRRLHHPPRGRRDARPSPRKASTARFRRRRSCRRSRRAGGTCCGSSAWR